MKRLIVLLFLFAANSTSLFSQCTYCTSLEVALIDPTRVLELNLSAEGRTQFPPDIGKFTKLESLKLSENFLFEIDFSQLSLPELRVLDLSNNPGFNSMNLKGIADAFPQLEVLKMSNSSLSYIDPEIGKLSLLKHLDLSGNSISFLYDEIRDLKELQILNISNNQFESIVWLQGLWNLKELNFSGNKNMNLEDIGTVMLGKQELDELSITPTKANSGIPSALQYRPLRKLKLKGFKLDSPNRKFTRNKAVREIVMDSCKISHPERFYSWLNAFENLEKVTFRNMRIPDKLFQVKNVEEILFDRCDFENVSDLMKVKPSIKISAYETDIEFNGFIGNAQKAKMAKMTKSNKFTSAAMVENNVSEIASPVEEVFNVSAMETSKIELENSEYSIPENAFLTENGELYTGVVKLSVKEYMDPVVNALSGAPMTFRGTTNELFSSAGMIEFRAYDENGNELKPNPENLIRVGIKDLQPSQSSDFYVFNESTRNWEEVGTPEATDWDARKQYLIDSLNKLPESKLLGSGFKVIPPAIYLNHKRRRHDPYEMTFHHHYSGKLSGNKRKIKQEATFSVVAADPTQRWMCKGKTWKIDTLISPEFKSLLKQIKKEQKLRDRVIRSGGVGRRSISRNLVPRIVRNIRIKPDFEQDNYRLTFDYKDSSVSLPVYIDVGNNPTKVQAKERRYYEEYKRASKKAKKEANYYEAKKEDVIKAQRKALIERQANSIIGWEQQKNVHRERLGFELSGFGFANCDYFDRNEPDGYIALAAKGKDENGNAIEIPDEIRSIYMNEQVYMLTDRNRVAQYSNGNKSIFLFPMSGKRLGVITDWTGDPSKSVANVTVMEIGGLSAGQIRDKLFGL